MVWRTLTNFLWRYGVFPFPCLLFIFGNREDFEYIDGSWRVGDLIRLERWALAIERLCKVLFEYLLASAGITMFDRKYISKTGSTFDCCHLQSGFIVF